MKLSIKKSFSIIGFLFLLFQTKAQDMIILKSGDEVQSKILEIGSTEIKYKKFENIEGPSYTIMKAEVFMIKYKNGSKDVFNETAPAVVSKPAEAAPAFSNNMPAATKKNFDNNTPLLGLSKKGFNLLDNNGSIVKQGLTKEEMQALLKGNPEALDLYNKAMSQARLGKILSYTGLAAVVVGAGLTVGGVVVLLNQVDKVSINNLDQDVSGDTGLWVSGGIFLAAGLGCSIASIPISFKAQANAKKTVESYSRNQRGQSYLEINLKYGLGLAYHF